MSTNVASSQSKKQNALIDNLKLRYKLWARKNATPSGLKQNVIRLFMYILIIGLAFVFLYPFLYMISTSLMSNADINSSSVKWIPTDVKFENYAIALDLIDGKQYAKNSFMVTIIATVGHVISCSFIGYGFARYNFPGKKILFACVILAFIVPIQTLIIPYYLQYANMGWLDIKFSAETGLKIAYSKLGWLNSYKPILVPTFFGFGLKGALYIFLFRQFFLTVPRSLEEAARIDGCGFMKTYWKIVFPLAKATIVVAIVLSVVWHWNDVYEPSIYILSPKLAFLPPKLQNIIAAANALPEEQAELMASLGLADGEDTLNNAVVMAGAVIISAPILIFFAFAQRQFMQGIERSGITGE